MQEHGSIYVPCPAAPDEALMSRFLAKVALKCLALRLLEFEGYAEMVTSEATLASFKATFGVAPMPGLALL